MSQEQHLIPTTTRHSGERAEAHFYFVGRRESEAAAVYTVTGTSVERLRSNPTTRQSSFDWHGMDRARLRRPLALATDRRRRPRVRPGASTTVLARAATGPFRWFSQAGH